MPRKRQGAGLPMIKFREILRLHDLGLNTSEIARSCVVARSTVRDYVQRATRQSLHYEQLEQLSDSEIQHLLGKGRNPSKEQSSIDYEEIHRELQHKGVTLALLWMEKKEKGELNYSYSGFCRRYRQWKKAPKSIDAPSL